MNILAIDPGCDESAFVHWDGARILAKGKIPNAHLHGMIRGGSWSSTAPPARFVCEMVASYGMAVGREVFETVYWIGRFCECWYQYARSHTAGSYFDATPHRLVRRDVKMFLCGNNTAKDANIRQAILDRFGGKAAIGKKASPGLLYGMSGDLWAAFAVALTFEGGARYHWAGSAQGEARQSA